MNRLVRLLFVLLMVFTALPSHAAEQLTMVTRTPHFLIHHPADMKITAEVLGNDSEVWLQEIAARLNARSYLKPLIPMFIYRNQEEYTEATGLPRAGMVLGRASSLGQVEVDASGVFAPASQIAGHEITHVIIFRILSPNVDALPLWMNEGIAKYMTDDFNQTDQNVLADAVIDGSIFPLQKISHRFPKGEGEAVAYAEGTSAVRFFVARYGEKKLASLVHETGRSGSFDDAMRRVAGISPGAFEREWRVSIEGRFGIARILRITRIVVAFGWPVLLIAAYLAFRRKRRRVIEQYEQDEWEEANWRDWGGR